MFGAEWPKDNGGGNFEGTKQASFNAPIRCSIDLVGSHDGDRWFAHHSGLTALTRNHLIVDPCICFFEPAAQSSVRFPA